MLNFPNYICPKLNVIARMEFEITNYIVDLQPLRPKALPLRQIICVISYSKS